MAQRSTKVTLYNDTNFPLRLLSATLSHGVWSERVIPLTPPEIIAINSQGEWQSESQGFETGTEGTVQYRMQIDTGGADTLDITIHWDNPFFGSNSYEGSKVSSKRFKVNKTYGGLGDNTEVIFHLE